MLEQSLAVKCPSIACVRGLVAIHPRAGHEDTNTPPQPSDGRYQLVGAKKIQQALCEPGEMERFMEPSETLALRPCFAGMWPADRAIADARAKIDDAIARPEAFVLKPQREGGGNNLFGDELREALRSMPEGELQGYILMERIRAPTQRIALLSKGGVEIVDGIFELGVFGTFLGDGERVQLNRQAGHLVRVKSGGVDESGVAAGYGFLSSPVLTPE